MLVCLQVHFVLGFSRDLTLMIQSLRRQFWYILVKPFSQCEAFKTKHFLGYLLPCRDPGVSASLGGKHRVHVPVCVLGSREVWLSTGYLGSDSCAAQVCV